MVACDLDSMCLYFQSSKLDGVIWQVSAGILQRGPFWADWIVGNIAYPSYARVGDPDELVLNRHGV
jgi:hypothetical protein